MPFRMMYALSDFAFLIVYYVIGYRRKIVFQNLKNSFPEKSDEEILDITIKFYHHFCDVMLESVKVYSMPIGKVVERFRIPEPEEIDKLADQGKPFICVAGHYNNWEWGGIASEPQIKHRAIGFYKPLTNKYVDQYVARHRTRERNRVASIERTSQTFQQYSDFPSVFYMIADQSPPKPRMVHWVSFMNQETAVLPGPERYAKMLDYPVYFANIIKVKRGYYQLKFIPLTFHPKETKTGEISRMYMNMLEQNIRENPAFYLWSHRRWKLKRPAGATISEQINS